MVVDRPSTRRRSLLAAGSAVVGLVAGCTRLTGDEPSTERGYPQLRVTPTYVAAGVDLTVPDGLPTVNAPHNADLVVLPDDTGIAAERAVDWFARDRVIALVGADAETTWHEWVRSDAFDGTFDDRGFADAEPDPYLLVVGAVGLHVRTHRHSWGDPPTNADLLRAIDDDLAAIESETPR